MSYQRTNLNDPEFSLFQRKTISGNRYGLAWSKGPCISVSKSGHIILNNYLLDLITPIEKWWEAKLYIAAVVSKNEPRRIIMQRPLDTHDPKIVRLLRKPGNPAAHKENIKRNVFFAAGDEKLKQWIETMNDFIGNVYEVWVSPDRCEAIVELRATGSLPNGTHDLSYPRS